MTWLDIVFLTWFVLIWPMWSVRSHRAYLAEVRAGTPGARLAAYAQGAIAQWLLSACIVALWIHLGREWETIGMARPVGWMGWAAAAVAVVIGGLLMLQSAAVARRPESHAEVRTAIRDYAEVLPVRRSDLSGFTALALTAGVCEELLFRGYLAWVLAHWLGAWGGQAGALIVFAVAHLHLGRSAVLRAFLAGVFLAGLYLWSGSLLPSIILHALIDVSAGLMGYIVLREDGASGAGQPVASAATG